MTHTTLAAPARLESEIRKSRFLALAAPAESPEAAAAFIEQVSDPAATHNCWAWRIGQTYRFSDDGEPASSAGKPILAAIDGQSLDRVAVVVIRWFGGIKLGIGGLIRAYGGTAAECLRQAERRQIIPHIEAQLKVAFDQLGTIHQLLADPELIKLEERYAADGVHFRLRLPEERFAALGTTIRDATRGQSRLIRTEPAA